MNHGSLFSGGGGFDLPAHLMGWENKFHCEIEPFNRKILSYYWPNAVSYEDITKTDFSIWRGKIDIITGGFPCQPYSNAGKRKGTEDPRHLWPHMLRAIREIQPRWIVGENVPGLLNWSEGVVFEQIYTDLENEGYQVQSVIIPALAVDAPHQRDRLWIVGNANKDTNIKRYCFQGEEYKGLSRTEQKGVFQQKDIVYFRFCKVLGIKEAFTYSNKDRLQRELQQNSIEKNGTSKTPPSSLPIKMGDAFENWEEFYTQSPLASFDDGFPTKLDGITFPKWRQKSIEMYGNAVVPQVVYEIFHAIQQYDITQSKIQTR